MAFVHLHVHTQYSLLQGAIHMDALIEKVVQLGMPAVAITDTHNLFGAIDFYLSAKKAGIQPILGCELYYAPEGRVSGSPVHHLVVLCKNLAGYQNLCKMVTESYTKTPPPQKGQPVFPRAYVTRELLDQYGDHLVVLSGCIRGEIPYKTLFGEESAALESLQWFKKRFGPDFYLELQDTQIPEQDQINQTLVQWADRHGIGYVATSDCHYLQPEDAEAHEILQCIEHGKNLDFDRPKSLVPSEFHFKTEQHMREHFERFPSACDRTLEIAEKCKVDFRFKDENGKAIYHLPKFKPENAPENYDLNEYFREQARLGLQGRFDGPAFEKKRNSSNWAELEQSYRKRLEDELSMIVKTGFAGYFLIVADFINWAKRNDIPVGPGRGSGAGSLVAYSLNITDIDPIQFNLLFERFINPERISMPDFDVDFCQDRRGEVIDYVSRKYGKDNVCQIITFGKLQARVVIKDVGRVLGIPYAEMDLLTKLFPTELDITIDRALEIEPRLKEKMEADPKLGQVVRYARLLEGLYRNAGIHAAGVIITEKPVVTYCPLYVGRDGDLVTQFDKDFAEAIGLIKFDFLGLKTLTVIDNAVKLVRQVAQTGSVESHFSIDRIDYEDQKVFALISSGDTDGIFQIESPGMKDLCLRMQPSSLEDLTAINALYRPGPLGSGMVDDFIDRKHKRKAIHYEVPSLESILKDTYGVILYQEQVMQIARELAGYSLGQADLLRRAMGKKKPEEMAKHREIFVKGAVQKGLSSTKAETIFDLMAKFAEYGFNKSHSAAYGVLTYQTAYLKTHFPSEFMAALMTTEMDNTDKLTKYIRDARQHQILVLPPDINQSQKRFSVELIQNASSPKAIRFGLEAIKGVGSIAVDAILSARSDGKFQSVLDFCRRVSVRKVNKKVLESLCCAGALDSVAEVNRASVFASVEKILEQVGDEQEEKELGQASLFDAFSADEIKLVTPVSALFKNEPDWPSSKKLSLEKEVVGFYVSGHPMDGWQKIFEPLLGWNTEKLKIIAQEKAAAVQTPTAIPERMGGPPPRPPKTEVRLGGLLTEMKEVTTRKGTRMAFVQLEDLCGKIEVVVFPDTYQMLQELIKKAVTEAEPVLLAGEVEWGDEAPKVLAKTLEWAAEVHRNQVQEMTVEIDPDEAKPEQLRDLKREILQNRGKCQVRICFSNKVFKTQLELPKSLGVTASPQTVLAINQIFGRDVVKLHGTLSSWGKSPIRSISSP